MNEAHLHMVVNHFPIIGTIFGLGILITGLVLKNKVLCNTAYVLFIVAAVFGYSSMYTGEGAEEIAEKLPSVTDQVIHEHEELAEKLAVVLYILATISIIGLYLNVKNHAKAKLVSIAALTVAIVAVVLTKEVGTSGGEIRHTEIRANADGSETNTTANEKGGEEDDD